MQGVFQPPSRPLRATLFQRTARAVNGSERLAYEWRIHYLPSRGEIVAAPAGACAWEWLWVEERGAWVHLAPIPRYKDPRL